MVVSREPSQLDCKGLEQASAAIYSWGIAPILPRDIGSDRAEGRADDLAACGLTIVDGQRYLVSMLGENVQWVQNARASGGKAVLSSGGRQNVILEEVPADQRAPILKAYLQRAPGARPHVPVSKDAPLAEFQKIAAEFPVFSITSTKMG
jgi:hypothetical protein